MFVQFLVAILSILFVVKTVFDLRSKKINTRIFIFWTVIWTLILIVAILPDTTIFLSKILGVGRGVDVAVYFSIVLIFFILFEIVKKISKIEQEITKIVSNEALKDFKNKTSS